ncbi:MAG TPA: hypothetical protein EYH22_01055 [Candidatus Nanopusillus sp.]|nr:hypothetical protein [Candidatus Nanopusillus sp.]
MRAWIVLLEVGVSILLLTIFYIYMQDTSSSYEKVALLIDPEIYRSLDSNCSKFPNLTYHYYDFSKNVYCKNGRAVKELEGEPKFVYFYAGNKAYNPKVITIFK